MKNPIVEAALRSGLVLDARSDFAHALGALAASDSARAKRLASSSATIGERIAAVTFARGVDAAKAIEFASVFGAPDPIAAVAASMGIGTGNGLDSAIRDSALVDETCRARGLDASAVSAFARVFGFRGNLGESLARSRG